MAEGWTCKVRFVGVVVRWGQAGTVVLQAEVWWREVYTAGLFR